MQTGFTALHYAASKDTVEVAELLLSRGASTTAIDEVSNFPAFDYMLDMLFAAMHMWAIEPCFSISA